MAELKEKKAKGAFSGFLSYFYGNFVVLLLGFIQTPLVTRLMSTEEYGRTGMFETAVSCIYIFAIMGMDQAYIRYYYKKGIDRRKLLRQCIAPALCIIGLLLLVYFVAAGRVNGFLFGVSGIDVSLLVAAYTLISVLERFLFLDVRMQQNGKLYSNINIAQKVLNIIFIFVAFHFLHDDFRVVLYAMTLSWGSTTLFLLLRYFFMGKAKKGAEDEEAITSPEGDKDAARSDPQAAEGYPLKELLLYGIPFIFVLLMEWLLSSCDRVALKLWADYGELGIYSAAMKIMVLLLTFKNTFLAYWSPVAMERYESGGDDCKAFFRSAFDIVRFFCILMALGMIFFRHIIVLLLGSSYRGADRVIPFLTLMPAFAMMFEITVQGIKFKKQNRYLNLASIVAILCNIIGNSILVPSFKGIGAALATGLSYLAYFAMASFSSEKVYPVGYDYSRTALDAVILIVVALLASFYSNYLLVALAAALSVIAVCAIEKKSILLCLEYVKKVAVKLMSRGRECE